MRVFVSLITAAVLTAGLLTAACSAERTPPGSYLIYRVTTVSQLRSEIAKNSLVRSRYAKHFGVSPSELDAFFATEVKLIALKSPVRTQCWYINKAGGLSAKSKLLPSGTMVFATRDGAPLLSWSCGNPLTSKLPQKKVAKAQQKLVKPQTKVLASTNETVTGQTTTVTPTTKPVETKVANSVEVITNAAITAPPAPAVVSVAPVEAAPALASIAAPAVSAAPAIATAGGLGFGWLGALGAAGGAAAALSNGGGSRSPVVPEPASFAFLATAICGLPVFYGFRLRRH